MDAEEGKAARGYAAIERASALCCEVQRILEDQRIGCPSARELARELLLLNERHYYRTGASYPLEDLTMAFWILVPGEAR